MGNSDPSGQRVARLGALPGLAQARWPVLAGLAAFICLAPGAVATRANSEQAALAKLAAHASATAQKTMQAGNTRRAIAAAERAVAAMPRSATYRVQLGQAYMMAGRFSSAEMAFADALTLDPNNSSAILKLALARIALGQAKAARDLLESRQSELSASDYGLALTLAGDAAAGIAVLVPAVRAGEANAQLRQNLALAFAVSGRWEDARAMALVDLPPERVDTRLKQWAALARPDQPWAQMAQLMGLKVPANWHLADPGQPQELALGELTPPETALAQGEVRVAPAPMRLETPVAMAPAMIPYPEGAETPVADPPRYEVAADVKDPVILPASVKRMAVAGPPANLPSRWTRALRGPGRYVVQIGAYRSSSAAARSWSLAAKRWRHLQAYGVHQARVEGTKGTIYRVSLGKFASREEARQLCAQLRAQGGSCFPRAVTGADTLRYAARPVAPPRLLALR